MSGDDEREPTDPQSDGPATDRAGDDGSGDGGDGEAADGDEVQWRFGLDDVGEDAGPPPLEPGSPAAENVLFVLVGVALAAVLIAGVV